MFSQLRHAVETFVPPPRHSIDEHRELPESPSRSRSLDSTAARPASPGQLADSALSNLRKSLGTNRSASPGAKSPNSASSPRKTTLEERLRASFILGEASSGTTPNASARSSPSPVVAMGSHTLSPASTPLPSSPVISAVVDSDSTGSVQAIAASPTPVLANGHALDISELPSLDEPTQNSTETAPPASDPLLGQIMDSPPIEPQPTPLAEIILEEPEPIDEAVSPTNAPEVVPSETSVPPEDESEPSLETIVPPEIEPELLSETPSPSVDVAQVHGETIASPVDGSNSSTASSDVETLQERLKLVEQRFTDVSTSFKRLQAEKTIADNILREFTPLETLRDSESLSDYLRNVKLKAELSQEEMKRLNGKLRTQEERIEELRDTHRLESKSQSELIDQLRRQIDEAEALVKASQGSISQREEDLAKQKAEIDRLQGEVNKSNRTAKEEEEKRVKAISLLKTVRQKLVKAEKDKEESAKELGAIRDREREEREKQQNERTRLLKEIDAVNAEREKAVVGLKNQFDKEVGNVRDRYEREIAALKGQFELEAVTAKSTYAKELSSKGSQISQLEASLTNVSRDKNAFFDQLQLRQAELESSQSHLESLQSQNAEMQYQLRESEDRIALLSEELAEARREKDDRAPESVVSSEDVARLLSAAGAKYESKLGDLKRSLNAIERERNDSEADWSRKLREKVKETEDLKRVLGSATRSKHEDQGVVDGLKTEIERLREGVRLHQAQVSDLQGQMNKVKDDEDSVKAHESELKAKIQVLQQQVEEVNSRESQLRANNKTLREELRKVQSSAALLERQRNPGVGYWTSKGNAPAEPRSSISSAPSDPISRVASPAVESSTSSNNDEEVNLEYLRNVILQFLEHKEMRPNLVKVLSIILHFTPQETRRLIAKV